MPTFGVVIFTGSVSSSANPVSRFVSAVCVKVFFCWLFCGAGKRLVVFLVAVKLCLEAPL